MEGLAAAMEPKERSMGWLVAPTYDLTDKIYREMVIIAAQHLRHRIISMKDNEKRLILRNMAGGLSEIRGKSADNPVRKQYQAEFLEESGVFVRRNS